MKKEIVDDTQASYLEDSTVPYDENRDFISLDAWKKAKNVKLFFYEKVLPLLPEEENLD